MTDQHAQRSASSTALAAALRSRLSHSLPQGLSTPWRTRFAPAPTGYLHLGHVVNAIHVWGIAAAYGGHVVLRIEDHDQSRCRPAYERALLDDLEWLGFAANVGSIAELRRGQSAYRQSDNLDRYQQQLDALSKSGLIYACRCSRREVIGNSAHQPGREARYPGTCRELALRSAEPLARRIRVSGECETFDDLRLGLQTQCPAEQCGDFVVRDRNGNFTYQFSVAVDDWLQDIALVIRGEDLLPSTGRQIQLARGLGRESPPAFLHHQLIMREDGIKLSKSLGDTGVREMRSAGLSAAQVLGRAAFASGLTTVETPLAFEELLYLFA